MSGDSTSKFVYCVVVDPHERRRERGSDNPVGASSRCVKPLVGHHRQRLYLSCTSAVKDEVLKLSNDHHLLKAVWRSAVNPSRCQLLQKVSSNAVTTNLSQTSVSYAIARGSVSLPFYRVIVSRWSSRALRFVGFARGLMLARFLKVPTTYASSRTLYPPFTTHTII